MDTAFVTFNNLPPRMVAKEMKMHVAAPESCFQAPSADRCFEEIQQWMPPMSLCWKASFRSLFESLCMDDLTGNMRHFVAALGPLNLFTIISGRSSSALSSLKLGQAANFQKVFIHWYFSTRAFLVQDIRLCGLAMLCKTSKIYGTFTSLHLWGRCPIQLWMRAILPPKLCGRGWDFVGTREISGY